MNPLFANGKATQMIYGGDYNPEQWPEKIWREDAQLMQEAGVNFVSLGIFSWAKLEPSPGEYNFAWLDKVIELLYEHGVCVNLATATASPPPWLSRRYPESLPVAADGSRYHPGSRQHYCPNSQAYQDGARALTYEMAQRYREHPAVVMWHLNNEYGCHLRECYCEVCTAVFREWLQNRYQTIERLNETWGTAFWSQQIGDWGEIQLPNRTMTFYNPAHMLDYRRFMNASLLNLFRAEVAAIKEAGAAQPITTNYFWGSKAVDYFEWAKEMDAVALDMYPDPAWRDEAWFKSAFWHDLTRSQGGGKPYLVMEQATTQVNWRPINQLKPPGMMRALSYQALARGADGIMFFQWRASRAGAEKFHSAMVPHFGSANSRVFAEVKQLGQELRQLTAVTEAKVPAQVGVLFSYQNLWALELNSKPALLDAWDIVPPWYQALLGVNVPVDIVEPDADFSRYRVLLAPHLYQLTEAQAMALTQFVANGGTLILTYFSGIVNLNEQIWLGGYPALLKEVLGLVVEEWQPLLPTQQVAIEVVGETTTFSGSHWVDLLHTTTAETVATYRQDFYAGRPAITRNVYGSGLAYYVGTRPERPYLTQFLTTVLQAQGIVPLLTTPANVEVGLREAGDKRYLFVINHGGAETAVDLQTWQGTDLLTGREVAGRVMLPPYGVLVVALD